MFAVQDLNVGPLPVKRDDGRPLGAHVWAKEPLGFYVEPEWCSERLFAVEKFAGSIWDPCCGIGRIADAAHRVGYSTYATDIVDRGYRRFEGCADFLQCDRGLAPSIVCNPPFDRCDAFVRHALDLTRPNGKVAMIWLVRRLNAARWLARTPLARIHLLTPRPSMPPGQVILAGERPGGGTQDFAWLVFDHKHKGSPSLHWLHRDAEHSLFPEFPRICGEAATAQAEIAPSQAKASSLKPIAIYEISEVTASSKFRVQVTTATEVATLPQDFCTLNAARRACTDHLGQQWRHKMTQTGE